MSMTEATAKKILTCLEFLALEKMGCGFTNDDVRVIRPSHLSLNEKKAISAGRGKINNGKFEEIK